MVGSATFREIVDPTGAKFMQQMRKSLNLEEDQQSCMRWDNETVYSKFNPLLVIYLPALDGQAKPNIQRLKRSYSEDFIIKNSIASDCSQYWDVNESYFKQKHQWEILANKGLNQQGGLDEESDVKVAIKGNQASAAQFVTPKNNNNNDVIVDQLPIETFAEFEEEKCQHSKIIVDRSSLKSRNGGRDHNKIHPFYLQQSISGAEAGENNDAAKLAKDRYFELEDPQELYYPIGSNSQKNNDEKSPQASNLNQDSSLPTECVSYCINDYSRDIMDKVTSDEPSKIIEDDEEAQRPHRKYIQKADSNVKTSYIMRKSRETFGQISDNIGQVFKSIARSFGSKKAKVQNCPTSTAQPEADVDVESHPNKRDFQALKNHARQLVEVSNNYSAS
ncbi:hypothetical protein FGO68_gene11169 [Halteria grandinella]|uniref:Uncharacterized protein n=1 Tax=Halteria grandinella TaxID=5974 RepID=A0A8J8P0G4_HALGN|nr:hypothetical protein FGO68_gene11169 [Halteria grandinella]